MLVKRLLFPRGPGGLHHYLFGIGDPWCSVISYSLFGLAAGLGAGIVAWWIIRRKKNPDTMFSLEVK